MKKFLVLYLIPAPVMDQWVMEVDPVLGHLRHGRLEHPAGRDELHGRTRPRQGDGAGEGMTALAETEH